MPPLPPPLADAKNFSLNSAGVAGFFGGKEAISAMATVHMYRGRRWLGWFNSPGSYVIAKRFGRMANSRFWDGLFPGPNDSPAVTFGLDGKKGPKYIAALSGTRMQTGHLAYLTIERSKNMEENENLIEGRQTTPIGVTYLAMKPVNYDELVKREPVYDALLGLIPISVSMATCIMCAVYHDWYSFSMILLGIISSGLASIIIGRGRLIIKSVDKPASGAPPGHGILMGDDEVVVIKGNERDVNAITKGHFVLETGQKQIEKKEGVGPEQGGKEKLCCNGRCNCPKRGDERNNVELEPCGNGECNNPKQEEGNVIDPKHADQAIFIKEMAISGKGKEGEVNPITDTDNAKFVEVEMAIRRKGQEVDVTEGRPNLETGPKQDDRVKCIDPERGDEKKVTEPGPRSEGKDGSPAKGHQKGAVEPQAYDAIGCSSLLLLLQFLLQLLLIPQGSLFGQIMFLVSLGVSWGYNSYLSSLEKEKIQTYLLFQTLGNPEMRRFRAGTRTTMVVFVCLLLFHGVRCKSLEDKKKLQIRVIRLCLSNDTPVWKRWLDKVMEQILNLDGPELPYLQMDEEDQQFFGKDRELLRNLLKDAAAAIRKYLLIRDSLPEVLSNSVEEQETTEHCACDAHCIHCDCNAPI